MSEFHYVFNWAGLSSWYAAHWLWTCLELVPSGNMNNDMHKGCCTTCRDNFTPLALCYLNDCYSHVVDVTYVTTGVDVWDFITSKTGQRTLLQRSPSIAFLFIWGWHHLTPPHPYSVSITGNNRRPSFLAGWRWFPQGATGSLRCQPASPPQRERERENWVHVPVFSFPFRPLRRDLTHGLAAVISEIDTRWTEACQAYKVTDSPSRFP